MGNKRALLHIIWIELKRSATIKFFVAALGVVLCICLDTWNQLPFLWSPDTGVDVHYYWLNSMVYGGFYSVYVIPMLSALPFALSFCEEHNTNMIKTLIIKTGKKNYCISKIISVFFSGAVSTLTGGIFFTAITGFFVPLLNRNRLIEVEGFPYFYLLQKGNGAAYFAAVFFLLFLSGGLWAVTALFVSVYFPNTYVAAASPLILSFLTGRVCWMIKIPERFRLDLWLRGRSSVGTDFFTLLCSGSMVVILTILFGRLFYKKLKWRMEHE